MKFKLDENLGTSFKQLFMDAAHDANTVVDQKGLKGCTDGELYDHCRIEKRCLVTLDLDFSDVLRFPPRQTYGVMVIRLPKKPDRALLRDLLENVLKKVVEHPLQSHLWIVEPGRIRIHQAEDD